jgi:hypothetical protein
MTTKSLAGGILIQAAGTSHTEFETFLKDQSEMISFSQYQVQRLQSNTRQEEELYKMGENLDATSKNISDSLRALKNSGPLSSTSINFLYDLSNRLQERPDLNNNFEIKMMNCKARSLVGMPLEKCPKVRVDFTSINRQWPTVQTLLIESASYQISTASSLELSNDAVYEFQLISDTHKAIQFKGTYLQLMQQHFVFEPMIEGSCREFSSSIDDFNIQNAGTVFFSKECLKAVNAPPTGNRFSEWMDANKSWVYPVGALLIGSAAAYGLKDKKIVIDKP